MLRPNVATSAATCICLDLANKVFAVDPEATATPPSVKGGIMETFKVTPNAGLPAFDPIRNATAASPWVSHDQLSVPGLFDPGKMIWVSSRSAGEVDWTDRLLNLDVRQRIEDRPASDPSMSIDRAYDENFLRHYGVKFAAT